MSTANWILSEFAAGFAAAVAGFGGSEPSISVTPGAPPPASQSVWVQSFSGIAGTVATSAADADILTMGQRILDGAGLTDADPAECASTFRECLGQAFSVLTRSITTKLEREVTPADRKESAAVPADLQWATLQIDFAGQPVLLSAGISAAFLEAFAPKAMAQTAGGTSVETATRATPTDSKTFDLLLDVELPVRVSFGHARVPLKDVLKLTTGSIVELNRAIVEPVDLVVNNCVIAKGEVVVLEGNFGVRIQHVISRSERLRTLQ